MLATSGFPCVTSPRPRLPGLYLRRRGYGFNPRNVERIATGRWVFPAWVFALLCVPDSSSSECIVLFRLIELVRLNSLETACVGPTMCCKCVEQILLTILILAL